MSSAERNPRYPLDTAKLLVDRDACDISLSAVDGIYALGLTIEDAWLAIRALSQPDFRKSMSSEKAPGTMQDVYETMCGKHQIYLKIQVVASRHTGNQILRLVSFKRNEHFS